MRSVPPHLEAERRAGGDRNPAATTPLAPRKPCFQRADLMLARPSAAVAAFASISSASNRAGSSPAASACPVGR